MQLCIMADGLGDTEVRLRVYNGGFEWLEWGTTLTGNPIDPAQLSGLVLPFANDTGTGPDCNAVGSTVTLGGGGLPAGMGAGDGAGQGWFGGQQPPGP